MKKESITKQADLSCMKIYVMPGRTLRKSAAARHDLPNICLLSNINSGPGQRVCAYDLMSLARDQQHEARMQTQMF